MKTGIFHFSLRRIPSYFYFPLIFTGTIFLVIPSVTHARLLLDLYMRKENFACHLNL